MLAVGHLARGAEDGAVFAARALASCRWHQLGPSVELQNQPTMTTALLIIDMQRALCSGEDAAVGIDNVIEKVNALSGRARSRGHALPVAPSRAQGLAARACPDFCVRGIA
jgi:hypothetical protein